MSTTSQSPKKEAEPDREAAASTEASSKNMGDAAAATMVAATDDTGPKKRSARNQITKDDYDNEGSDDNDEDSLKEGFKRAPTEVLEKRKIYKVKRYVVPKPADASSENTSKANSTNETTKTKPPTSANSANPFAATSLVVGKKSGNDDSEITRSPFASVFAASGDGNKSASSSVKVFGSGGYMTSGGGGFAGIGSSPSNGKPLAFGVSTETSKGWFGGERVATSDASDGSSLFGKGTTSPVKFNFKSSNEISTTEKKVNTAATQLPLNVQLMTGEEDEIIIFSERCKSYVLQNEDKTETPASVNDATDGKANPSVKPSTEFQTAILSSKSEKDEKLETPETKAKEDKINDSTENANENGGGEDGKIKEELITSGGNTKIEGETPEQHRWQELGVGPIKILRSRTKSDRLRLVQRRESSKNGPATKVILNVPLWKESSCTRQDQQNLTLKTFENGKVSTYLFKFKENNQAAYFQHHVLDIIPEAREIFMKSDE